MTETPLSFEQIEEHSRILSFKNPVEEAEFVKKEDLTAVNVQPALDDEAKVPF